MADTSVSAQPFRIEVLTERRGSRWEEYDAGVRYPTTRAAWEAITSTVTAWGNVVDARIMADGSEVPIAVYTCSGCGPHMAGGLAPSHDGGTGCQSGSLASGGTRAHCTCDGCF